MWGLQREDLGEIFYKNARVVDKYNIQELWLRSDICRILKLIDLPILQAVDVEKLTHKLVKKRQKTKGLQSDNKTLTAAINRLTIELKETKAEKRDLDAKLYETNKELKQTNNKLEELNAHLNRERTDQAAQTDMSGPVRK